MVEQGWTFGVFNEGRYQHGVIPITALDEIQNMIREYLTAPVEEEPTVKMVTKPQIKKIFAMLNNFDEKLKSQAEQAYELNYQGKSHNVLETLPCNYI